MRCRATRGLLKNRLHHVRDFGSPIAMLVEYYIQYVASSKIGKRDRMLCQKSLLMAAIAIYYGTQLEQQFVQAVRTMGT